MYDGNTATKPNDDDNECSYKDVDEKRTMTTDVDDDDDDDDFL